jgi:hypothetical protein
MVDGVKRDENVLTALDIISTAFTESITSLVLIKRVVESQPRPMVNPMVNLMTMKKMKLWVRMKPVA